MGLFSKLFGKETNDVVANTVTHQANQSKEVHSAEVKAANMTIDMSKSKENLDKVLINMSKSSKVDMTKHTARVALAMDYSGSMNWLFNNGSVQKTITRLLPIALKFDDNRELESWLFSNGKERLQAVNNANYKNYVKDVMQRSRMSMGGTNYAPVLRDIVNYYKDIEPSTIPAFIIFITDGDNFDKEETNDIVRELSKYNMFVQFIGIGDERFSYLKSLDNLKGRNCDNTGFTAVSDMNKMTDEELYTEILRQYKDWLNNK